MLSMDVERARCTLLLGLRGSRASKNFLGERWEK